VTLTPAPQSRKLRKRTAQNQFKGASNASYVRLSPVLLGEQADESGGDLAVAGCGIADQLQ